MVFHIVIGHGEINSNIWQARYKAVRDHSHDGIGAVHAFGGLALRRTLFLVRWRYELF